MNLMGDIPDDSTAEEWSLLRPISDGGQLSVTNARTWRRGSQHAENTQSPESWKILPGSLSEPPARVALLPTSRCIPGMASRPDRDGAHRTSCGVAERGSVRRHSTAKAGLGVLPAVLATFSPRVTGDDVRLTAVGERPKQMRRGPVMHARLSGDLFLAEQVLKQTIPQCQRYSNIGRSA